MYRNSLVCRFSLLVRAAVAIDGGADSFYFFVDDVLEFSRGAQRELVATPEIRLLTFAHLGDCVKEFSSVHFLV